MRCPKCGSLNVQFVTSNKSASPSIESGVCGYLILGSLGFFFCCLLLLLASSFAGFFFCGLLLLRASSFVGFFFCRQFSSIYDEN